MPRGLVRPISVSTLFLLMISFVFSGLAYAGPAGYLPGPRVQVMLNGRSLAEPGFIANGVAMVPLRAIADATGARVTWDAYTQTSVVTRAGHTVTLRIGSQQVWYDGWPFQVPAAARIWNDRAYVPLRFTAEGLALGVAWNAYSNTATLATTTPTNVPASELEQGLNEYLAYYDRCPATGPRTCQRDGIKTTPTVFRQVMALTSTVQGDRERAQAMAAGSVARDGEDQLLILVCTECVPVPRLGNVGHIAYAVMHSGLVHYYSFDAADGSNPRPWNTVRGDLDLGDFDIGSRTVPQVVAEINRRYRAPFGLAGYNMVGQFSYLNHNQLSNAGNYGLHMNNRVPRYNLWEYNCVSFVAGLFDWLRIQRPPAPAELPKADQLSRRLPASFLTELGRMYPGSMTWFRL